MTGDGLRIFPGALGRDSLLTVPWRPDATLTDAQGYVRREFLWAALDCTSAFPIWPEPGTVAILLGALCADIGTGLRAGSDCVVLGWKLGSDGRRKYTASAVFAADGRLLGRARATWFEVPLSTWA
ncbi:MAG: hypothetical protein FJ197_11550 [Gammaproteobacteria bacterium]|nr:hypothetical protein [Gammaproteobacteria bacterium]